MQPVNEGHSRSQKFLFVPNARDSVSEMQCVANFPAHDRQMRVTSRNCERVWRERISRASASDQM
jgi:hypothetical protein